jgi:hypothetical protein
VLEQNLDVFRDEIEGYSFRPSPGWLQAARANVSPDERGREHELVKYKRGTGSQLAFFRVSAVDLPDGTDIAGHLDKTFGKDDKRTSTKPEELKLGGAAATRETYSTKWDRQTMVREVVIVRRGPRVYFFTGTFSPSDKTSREEVRKMLDSVVWEHERKD